MAEDLILIQSKISPRLTNRLRVQLSCRGAPFFDDETLAAERARLLPTFLIDPLPPYSDPEFEALGKGWGRGGNGEDEEEEDEEEEEERAPLRRDRGERRRGTVEETTDRRSMTTTVTSTASFVENLFGIRPSLISKEHRALADEFILVVSALLDLEIVDGAALAEASGKTLTALKSLPPPPPERLKVRPDIALIPFRAKLSAALGAAISKDTQVLLNAVS
eukprot:CAMPEP_0175064810 /NCGR_PEP_ID=MMETSP0052_2-20121109/15553_1 /TAXON_ID=51329 ORGANISM="Polytomella parva, Strain SAG 63-3" /NCGR_SAMPLE_ID=MMETSP0052_2 /ASSEMBLY_ACC=CAM_ASM_000194 /LENGTH=220 /DNA_ID=CAMNT_0016331229 /DNA_START=90 /DNA_END=748 /DNA_ORIENTATION=+